jgi:hypothetical protein
MVAFMNSISVIGTFLLLFGVIYFIQRLTFGLLPLFKKRINGFMSLGDLTFSLTTLLIIVTCVDILKPY